MKYKTIPLSIIIGEAFSDMNLDSEERNMHILKRQAHDVLMYQTISKKQRVKLKYVC